MGATECAQVEGERLIPLSTKRSRYGLLGIESGRPVESPLYVGALLSELLLREAGERGVF
jgi:hypothetical protein